MVIGLTGGLGCGKSLVAEEFERLGAHLIDADEIARDIVAPGSATYEAIVKEFGTTILRDDGEIERPMLAKIVFSDKEKLKRLNAVTHPKIREEIDRRIREIKALDSDKPIVVNAALLIEVSHHTEMDKVVVVYADEHLQIERVMKRDGLSEAEAKLRIEAQMPLNEKIRIADAAIENNGTKEEVLKKTREVFAALTGTS